MPNFIGTGNNQVPTNGMLGGLAYQSPDNAVIKNLELTNLSGHSSVIPSNAVDVFVYDTRKDSDGGAWRKRTQHTSWYNETLNTPTRGGRRDFPAVAVIVASQTSIIIYDGDDPDMPMWMAFNRGTDTSTTMLWDGNNANNCTSVFALNGIMMFSTSNAGSYGADFIGERWIYFYNGTSTSGFRYNGGGIVNRNSAVSPRTVIQPFSSVSSGSLHFDIAMAVLPNSTVDLVTGIPFPIIAVATNGGANIIRDDAYTVVTWLTNVGYISQILISKNYELFAGGGAGIAYYAWYNKTIPTSSTNNYDGLFGAGYSSTQLPRLGSNGNSNVGDKIAFSNDTIYFNESAGISTNNKLILLNQNTSVFGNSLVSYITQSYNTGWMHGNIRGAWLSDTSTASVTGTELITNGNFSNGTTGWVSSNSGSLSIVSGALRVNANGNAFGGARQSLPTLVVGRSYVLSADIGTISNASSLAAIVRASDGTNLGLAYPTANSKLSVYFVATETTGTQVLFESPNVINAIFDVDNVSARLVELDRSVNNRGLAVYGTVTKTPVATGSNLVAYSGFSSSNYLSQPYNSNLNFGTGAFSTMIWCKSPAGAGTYVLYSWRGTSGTLPLLQTYFGDNLTVFDVQDISSNNGGFSINRSLKDNVWHLLTVVQRNSSLREFYIDGILVGTNTTTIGSLTSTAHELRVGTHFDGLYAYNGSLALFRASASAPSTEQILKIYNDEKALFQPNSQCTLFGTSDTVTALAYDDTTRLLHVGTSSGRSDFQGLERVANTTTAVTTAISASNGLVAEQ